MPATSLLDFHLDSILRKVERLAGVRLPKDVIEVSLEPKLNVLCIRFRKPIKSESGEPVYPGIHLFLDGDTEEITALEIINPERIAEASVIIPEPKRVDGSNRRWGKEAFLNSGEATFDE